MSIDYCSEDPNDIALNFLDRNCWACKKKMSEISMCPLKGLVVPDKRN